MDVDGEFIAWRAPELRSALSTSAASAEVAAIRVGTQIVAEFGEHTRVAGDVNSLVCHTLMLAEGIVCRTIQGSEACTV